MSHKWVTNESHTSHITHQVIVFVMSELRLSHEWVTNESRMSHKWVTNEFRISHKWVTNESQMSHKWVTNESRMSHEWVTNESRMSHITHQVIVFVMSESRLSHEWVTIESRISHIHWLTPTCARSVLITWWYLSRMSHEWVTNESRMSRECRRGCIHFCQIICFEKWIWCHKKCTTTYMYVSSYQNHEGMNVFFVKSYILNS